MAVPTRPASGAVVESAWGQVAHDTAVALDYQYGTVTPGNAGSGNASSQITVTFPRPFASPPIVVVGSVNFNYFAGLNGNQASATQFTCAVFRPIGGGVGAGSPINWIAIGPRA